MTDVASGRALVIWYDGACPLCSREVAAMRRLDRRGRIDFVDVSAGAPQNCPVDHADLLARFHGRERGRIVSGACAFAAMWRAIPLLWPIGVLAGLPGLSWLFERGYRLYLRHRPRLQRMAGR